MAGAFGAAGFVVVAGGNVVAVSGAEAAHYPDVLDRGLERSDPMLEFALLRVDEGLSRSYGAV